MSNEPTQKTPSPEDQLAEANQIIEVLQRQRNQLSSQLYDLDAKYAVALARIQKLSAPPAPVKE